MEKKHSANTMSVQGTTIKKPPRSDTSSSTTVPPEPKREVGPKSKWCGVERVPLPIPNVVAGSHKAKKRFPASVLSTCAGDARGASA